MIIWLSLQRRYDITNTSSYYTHSPDLDAFIVKLHSEIANPTQLLLDGEQRRTLLYMSQEEEGRRRNNIYRLLSKEMTRHVWNLVAVLWVSEVVWKLSGECLEGVLRVSWGYMSKCIWRANQDWSRQDRSSQDRSSQDRPSQDGSSQTCQIKLWYRPSSVRTGQVKLRLESRQVKSISNFIWTQNCFAPKIFGQKKFCVQSYFGHNIFLSAFFSSNFWASKRHQ